MSGVVLVTGATGGLGRILVTELKAAGREIVATGRNREIGTRLQVEGVHFRPADLPHDDLTALCDGIHTVFHLAALSAPWGPHPSFVAANITATERLLDAARRCGCSRFIFASTPSIYTRAMHQLRLTEASRLPRRYANSYGETKHAAERAVLAAATPRFSTVALRPRAIIGPYDRVLLPRLMRAAAKGILPLPGGGKALIEPTDARDVAQAFMAAEAHAETANGRAFNISGGTPLRLADFVGRVFDRMGRKVRLIGVPARVALSAGALMEAFAGLRPHGREPLLTRYGAMVLGWSQTFDLTAARETLGWQPRRSPFEAIDWAVSGMTHA